MSLRTFVEIGNCYVIRTITLRLRHPLIDFDKLVKNQKKNIELAWSPVASLSLGVAITDGCHPIFS